jgi:glycosyltransferase involved in cell wall biosynthesis
MSSAPVTVAVTSWRRPLRLRWLLAALGEQTVSDFEVAVAFDPMDADTLRLLETHRLRRSGRLHAVPFSPESRYPGAGRNAAWRTSSSALVLFTDDDCRPASDWVQRAVAAAGRAGSDAVIQGRTLPDPDERATLLGAPWVQTMSVQPPTFWAPTCNIAYPRTLLEQLDGFDSTLRVGEDTDLAVRARRAGAHMVAEPAMVVFHAVHERWLGSMLSSQMMWRDLAALAARHPEVRAELWGGVWWKPEHAAFVAALVGSIGAARGRRWAAALALPWVGLAGRHRGFGPRGLGRSLTELPGRAAIDAAEILTLARGSAKYGTLML